MEIKNNISKLLKPSKPTPSNLRTYDISFFDEQQHNLHTSLILYYSSSEKVPSPVHADVFNQLEASLIETLTDFYPLAGRYMRHGSFVDCTDQGALYVQATANFQLSEFLGLSWELKYNMLQDLLPCEVGECGETYDPLLSIKVTAFNCGGVPIGMCFSHKVSDLATMSTFIDNWATKNQQNMINALELEKCNPIFNIPHDFSKKHLLDPSPIFPRSSKDAKNVVRLFAFKGSAISQMREKLMLKDDTKCRPSKVKLIVALLWKALVAADKANDDLSKPSAIVLSVNLRNKVVPKLPANLCGNFTGVAVARIESKQGDNMDLQGFLVKLDDSIKKVDKDCGKEQKFNNEQYEVLLEPLLELTRNRDVNIYTFMSWCKFSFYNADFGWGKPVWRSPGKYAAKRVVILMDDDEGDGVEAWVHLDENRMRLLEQDHIYSSV